MEQVGRLSYWHLVKRLVGHPSCHVISFLIVWATIVLMVSASFFHLLEFIVLDALMLFLFPFFPPLRRNYQRDFERAQRERAIAIRTHILEQLPVQQRTEFMRLLRLVTDLKVRQTNYPSASELVFQELDRLLESYLTISLAYVRASFRPESPGRRAEQLKERMVGLEKCSSEDPVGEERIKRLQQHSELLTQNKQALLRMWDQLTSISECIEYTIDRVTISCVPSQVRVQLDETMEMEMEISQETMAEMEDLLMGKILP